MIEALVRKNLARARIPLLISWALTHKCTQRCRYCKIRKMRREELNTKQIFSIIDQLSGSGTILICFSGGEPLLRDDIGEILAYTKKKKILFDISSNGHLVQKKIDLIKNARLICLSLDGPEDIHDKIRGSGSYSKVTRAAALLRKHNIPVYFRTVLSKMNTGCLDSILKLSRRMGIKVIFQPSTRIYYGNARKNHYAPTVKDCRKTVDRLILEKEKGEPYIFNSLEVLRYFKKWPGPAPIPCVSGKIFFHILPDGEISPCIWGKDPKSIKSRNCLTLGLAKAIQSIPADKCRGCWDAAACNFNFVFFQSSGNIKSLGKNIYTEV